MGRYIQTIALMSTSVKCIHYGGGDRTHMLYGGRGGGHRTLMGRHWGTSVKYMLYGGTAQDTHGQALGGGAHETVICVGTHT